jgi:hypothetical protein
MKSRTLFLKKQLIEGYIDLVKDKAKLLRLLVEHTLLELRIELQDKDELLLTQCPLLRVKQEMDINDKYF